MSDKEINNNPAEEAEDAPQETPAPAWPSPGQKLKQIREEMGLSHGRVADALHLTAHYIKALENDQYDKLPGKTFVKGYFRSYARLLGADVDEVLRCYEQFVGAIEESEVTEAQVIRARKAYDQNVRWIVCAAIIIVVVVGVSWWLARSGESDASAVEISGGSAIAEIPEAEDVPTAEELMANLAEMSQREPAVEPETADTGVIAMAWEAGTEAQLSGATADVAETGPQAAALVDETAGIVPVAATDELPDATTEVTTVESDSDLPDYTVTEVADNRLVQLDSDGEDLLEVHFSGASWIEVDNGDNTRLYNDMLDSGDDLTIRGKAPFNILIGDANVVDVTFNSRTVDLSNRTRTDNSARILLEPETH